MHMRIRQVTEFIIVGVLVCSFAAYAAPPSPSQIVSGLNAWAKHMPRAPHATYIGQEYCREKWQIILPQMVTYAQMPFSQARDIAQYMGMNTQPCADNWVARHILLGGFGNVGLTVEDGEETLDLTYAQHLFSLLAPRLLLQFEGEFSAPLYPDPDLQFDGVEYLNLTYFLGDRFSLKGGKVLNDFLFSNLRLHPSWITPYQDMPWVSALAPATTLGGKLGWNVGLGKGLLLVGTVFGGEGSTSRYFAAGKMVGARIGGFIPKHRLEFGVSGVGNFNARDPVIGAYIIKKWTTVTLHGETAADKDRFLYWVGTTYKPWAGKSGLLSRLGVVGRWQQVAVLHQSDDEAEEDHDEETGDHTDTDNDLAHRNAANRIITRSEEEGHDEAEDGEAGEHGAGDGGAHHGVIPSDDAQELYLGVIYDHAWKRIHVRFKIGGAIGFGEARDMFLTSIAFHW